MTHSVDVRPRSLLGHRRRKDTLLGAQALNVDGLGFLWRRGMQPGAAHTSGVSTGAAKSTSEGAAASAGALNGEGFAHDGAAPGQHLQIGHAARAGRDMMRRCRRRQGAQRGG